MRNMEEFNNNAAIKAGNAQHRISDMFLPRVKQLLLLSRTVGGRQIGTGSTDSLGTNDVRDA